MIDYLKNKSKFKNYFLNKKAINSYKKLSKDMRLNMVKLIMENYIFVFLSFLKKYKHLF